MSRHQKRLSVPESWPVERKTAKYTVKARAGPHGEAGVPLLIVLRDVLGYVDSKKEAKYATNEGGVLVNGESASDVRRPIGMFDILGFEERGEYFRVFPDEGDRLALTPIDESDADGKLGKIADKRHVSGSETQLQLHDGRNLRVEEAGEYSPGDSIVIDWDSEILARFPYEGGALVTAVQGQHAGEIGRIEEITVIESSAPNTVTIERDEDSFETIAEYVVVIDENFVSDVGTASENPNGGSREDGGDEQ